ncbi:hypothetical protein Y032_0534g3064 [Ancylostoma ceylanicum]|uniref:Uncharacterized protein n=1 Tax=Ancylostoma ceylanicum TaxID=53326 RepID=A0A016WSV7_9BILA|nr:hypothetical protein Y032_0534g3064 [Ancylostoma ceylanicum]
MTIHVAFDTYHFHDPYLFYRLFIMIHFEMAKSGDTLYWKATCSIWKRSKGDVAWQSIRIISIIVIYISMAQYDSIRIGEF